MVQTVFEFCSSGNVGNRILLNILPRACLSSSPFPFLLNLFMVFDQITQISNSSTSSTFSISCSVVASIAFFSYITNTITTKNLIYICLNERNPVASSFLFRKKTSSAEELYRLRRR